ncbi:transcriptional repressor DicA [Blautia hydrogenotrophica]|uniref:helix-turn-helix domain-containing protein n=3 Tax=Blautia hydrogenotrophica TaxID=53443 RepID=UPI0006C69997|nr:helix-turn-helix transcriptional regulator [Blautia hydrogenotrophica]CUM80388.1 transcriptional repressor DicA [Blautia hydrogenotrophica]SCH38046.1 transcriptional repressor DicA [uncultured Blautia sp.]
MEHYIKKMSFLGENIQTIRKHRKMKQQELADAIGINMQSLSKIERGVNYPTFDTLEKIMDVLEVTPNELLSGKWEYIDHTEPYIMEVIKREQDFNVSLDYLPQNEYFNSEQEYRFYMETKLMQYISNYITNEAVGLEELMEIKQLIQRQKLERVMKVHKEMRGLDRYREQPPKYKYHNPYNDRVLRELADIDRKNNIPDTSPEQDFDEMDFEEYLKDKWNRGL